VAEHAFTWQAKNIIEQFHLHEKLKFSSTESLMSRVFILLDSQEIVNVFVSESYKEHKNAARSPLDYHVCFFVFAFLLNFYFVVRGKKKASQAFGDLSVEEYEYQLALKRQQQKQLADNRSNVLRDRGE